MKKLFTYKIKQVIQRQIIKDKRMKIYKLIYISGHYIIGLPFVTFVFMKQMTQKINKIIRIINQKIKQKNTYNKFVTKVNKIITQKMKQTI